MREHIRMRAFGHLFSSFTHLPASVCELPSSRQSLTHPNGASLPGNTPSSRCVSDTLAWRLVFSFASLTQACDGKLVGVFHEREPFRRSVLIDTVAYNKVSL